MAQFCILLLCVAFLALIDAQPTLARPGDSRNSFIKLNDPSLGKKLLNKIKNPVSDVNDLIKHNDIPKKKEMECNKMKCGLIGKKESMKQKRTKKNKKTIF
uniref:Secreted protein n=1 Tax=Hydra oligactis TaxID=6088 RepID=B3VQ07_HYDOL|nr:secreted protein [Hydra oligactis]